MTQIAKDMTKKRDLDLICLTNTVTDVLVHASQQDVERFGLNKGGFIKKSEMPDYDSFLSWVSSQVKVMFPGGSPANVARTASGLGLDVAVIGTVGNDDYGVSFLENLKDLDVESLIASTDGLSGVCYVLVTPDGEKSTVANMGVSKDFLFEPDIVMDRFKEGGILHTSTYELESDFDRVVALMQYAQHEGVELSLDLGDPASVARLGDKIWDVLADVSILFAKEDELSMLYSGQTSGQTIAISDMIGSQLSVNHFVVLKRGAEGSLVCTQKGRCHIEAFKTNVVNTNGAGDSYAAGFLFGHANKLNLGVCGAMGTYSAAKVCGQDRAYLEKGFCGEKY
jgi:sugar/nucleoside kinase (ribokinase family)